MTSVSEKTPENLTQLQQQRTKKNLNLKTKMLHQARIKMKLRTVELKLPTHTQPSLKITQNARSEQDTGLGS